MLPQDFLGAGFYFFLAGPIAAVAAFKAPPTIRKIAQHVLLLSWAGYALAVAGCLWLALGRRPSSGIGNHVFLLPVIPLVVMVAVFFALWRGSRRHEYVQSLPPAERKIEELADIERGIEGLKQNLAAAQRKVERWGISSEERERLRSEISILESSIAQLEVERAKRQ